MSAPNVPLRQSSLAGQGRVVTIVFSWWLALAVVAVGWGAALDTAWPQWRVGFFAGAIWGLNALLLRYFIGPPFSFGRVVFLSTLFAVAMTVIGTGSYWATTQRFPTYRVFIERAGVLVAACTTFSLFGSWVGRRLVRDNKGATKHTFVWDWGRLRVLTYALAFFCVIGTWVSIRKIGYIPVLVGDPDSLRVDFPAIAGVWLRLSVMGVVVGLLVSVQLCARRASWPLIWIGVVCVACATLFGNRFFAALPLGAAVILWDRIRGRISMRLLVTGVLVIAPAMALLGWWRQQDLSVLVLSPLGLVLYGTLGEFRDLGWTIDYYSGGHPLLHGSTLGGLVVPLAPSFVWSAVGIDKAAVFANSNAAVLAGNMGVVPAERIGIYGELFMNFGWEGALIGAIGYGLLIGYLDRKFAELRDNDAVRGSLVAVAAVATIYAQVGQWNMLTATIVESFYPILAIALLAGRREARLQ